MLGLADGAAPRIDMLTQKPVAGRGTPVDVLVRYERDGKTVTEDSREWLLDFETKKPLKGARWYYVASAPRDGERIGAERPFEERVDRVPYELIRVQRQERHRRPRLKASRRIAFRS